MQIAILKERQPDEYRVAATPETVRKLIGLGYQVSVETQAGVAAACPDTAYEAVGASLGEATAITKNADLILKVQRPQTSADGHDELAGLRSGTMIVALANPFASKAALPLYAERGLSLLGLELVPRITRAQSMDVLSSQSNLAGYKSVLEAASEFGRAFPMMMTAAGTIPPARVLVMGAGVAGLQAIATARRLGAIVSATDVRLAAKEQVESLGASFVVAESDELREAQTAGGYAKEMSEDFKRKQAALIATTIAKQDIVITTALIPGRPAPLLVDQAMIDSMKAGSVIVDLAVEQGGNCAASKAGEIATTANGVKIIGHRNMPSRIAADASALFARNMLNFISAYHDKTANSFKLDPNEEIIKAMLLTHAGAVLQPQFT
jgi:H+-translocating NAD(P) transhydrogenase subunit alpha